MSFNKAEYENAVAYPKREDFVIFRVMDLGGEIKGEYVAKDLQVEYPEFASDVSIIRGKAYKNGKATSTAGDYILLAFYNKDRYDDALQAFRKGEECVRTKFYNDCCENIGLDPKSKLASVVFERAYDDGHSDGFYAVWNQMEELSDFVDDILNAVKSDEL